MKYILICAFVFSALTGCASSDRVSLVANQSQQALTRDGVSALISDKKHVVMLRPVASEIDSDSRPGFVLAVLNRGKKPVDLKVSNVEAVYSVDSGKTQKMHVYTYEELKSEEIRRQRWTAVATALQGAAASMSAANAGYSNTYGTYSGSTYGTYSGGLNGSYYGSTSGTFSARTYDAGKAYAAQRIANAQTSANFAVLRATGERNLTLLKNHILKDNTVMPGEWIGGRIIVAEPPKSRTGSRDYEISVMIDGEIHAFQVAQKSVS